MREHLLLVVTLACGPAAHRNPDAGASADGPRASDDASVPDKTWTEYWLLGQLPAQTTVFLYSRLGAHVTFGGTSSPMTVAVPPDTFVSYNAAALGYAATGTDWYFLEATGDANFMMSADRVVGGVHGDQLHDKPGHELHQHYYFPWAQSGPHDDKAVLFAPQQTTVTLRAVQNSGAVVIKTETFTGLFVSDVFTTYFPLTDNYSMEITADHPIAAALFDENDPPNTGYYFGWAGQNELYDEYMHVHSTSTAAYQSTYIAGANTLSYFRQGGIAMTTASYTAEKSEIVFHQALGYDINAVPYLLHSKATAPFGDWYVTPTATDVRAGASYMGWNSGLATLELYADSAATIKIYDGRNNTQLGSYSVAAGTIFRQTLPLLGFDPNEPFLMSVIADVPIYQEVRIPYFLRQYPAELGPVIL